METKTVKVPDMSCGHCLMRIKKEAGAVAGVKSVEGDVNTKDVTIEYEGADTWAAVQKALQDAGYPPQ